MLEDERGGLWIGTQRGLLFLPAPEAQNIRSIDGKPVRWTTDIAEDPRTGSVWLSTWGRGLFRLSSDPDPASPAKTRSTPTREDDRWRLEVRLDSANLNALGTAGWFRRDDAEWRRVHPELQAPTGYIDTTGAGVFWTNNGIVRTRPVPSAPIDTLRTWSSEHTDY